MKREYLLWEATRGREELQRVRNDVIASEFKLHLDVLLESANQLRLLFLSTPVARENRSAAIILKDGFAELRWRPPIDQDPLHLEGFSPRQRRWLYEALRVHTREEVPWRVFSDWSKAWDQSVSEARGLMSGFQSETPRSPVPGEDVSGVLMDLVWDRISGGSLEVPDEEVFVRALSNARLADDASISEVAFSCRAEARRLLSGDEAVYAMNALERLRAAAGQLEEALDELRLRPLLLRTRCDLCPA